VKTKESRLHLDLLRADLAEVILKLELDEIPIILAGDWNFTFNPNSHQQVKTLSKEDLTWHKPFY